MTTLAAFSASLITDTGRDIAARVTAMVERAGLPIEDALATAAEIGMTEGRAEAFKFSIEAQEALDALQAKYGELPR